MDGLILEAAAFQIHPKTGKWYLILGAKILNWIMPSIKVGGLEFWSISRKTSVCDKKEEIYPLYGDVAMWGSALMKLTSLLLDRQPNP